MYGEDSIDINDVGHRNDRRIIRINDSSVDLKSKMQKKISI